MHAVQTPVLPTVAQGPANQVTLTRAVLSLAVALMVALAPAVHVPVALLAARHPADTRRAGLTFPAGNGLLPGLGHLKTTEK